jgi:hypothetical protein
MFSVIFLKEDLCVFQPAVFPELVYRLIDTLRVAISGANTKYEK